VARADPIFAVMTIINRECPPCFNHEETGYLTPGDITELSPAIEAPPIEADVHYDS
jgi:hypothetical protein